MNKRNLTLAASTFMMLLLFACQEDPSSLPHQKVNLADVFEKTVQSNGFQLDEVLEGEGILLVGENETAILVDYKTDVDLIEEHLDDYIYDYYAIISYSPYGILPGVHNLGTIKIAKYDDLVILSSTVQNKVFVLDPQNLATYTNEGTGPSVFEVFSHASLAQVQTKYFFDSDKLDPSLIRDQLTANLFRDFEATHVHSNELPIIKKAAACYYEWAANIELDGSGNGGGTGNGIGDGFEGPTFGGIGGGGDYIPPGTNGPGHEPGSCCEESMCAHCTPPGVCDQGGHGSQSCSVSNSIGGGAATIEAEFDYSCGVSCFQSCYACCSIGIPTICGCVCM